MDAVTKLKGRDHMEDRELEGGKILKCVFKNLSRS